jgi:hypothetical protein
MATRNTSALSSQDSSPKTDKTKTSTAKDAACEAAARIEQTRAIAESQFRELLMNISSAKYGEEPEFPEPWEGESHGAEHWGNHFVWGSTQVNSDLALAAQCELEEDITADDPDDGIFEFCRSPMFWKLRQQFVKEATEGGSHAFIHLVWRCYSAGRLSPDRLAPRTPEQRRSYRRMIHTARMEANAARERRNEERAAALGEVSVAPEVIVQ